MPDRRSPHFVSQQLLLQRKKTRNLFLERQRLGVLTRRNIRHILEVFMHLAQVCFGALESCRDPPAEPGQGEVLELGALAC